MKLDMSQRSGSSATSAYRPRRYQPKRRFLAGVAAPVVRGSLKITGRVRPSS